jgi:hypothetical protein
MNLDKKRFWMLLLAAAGSLLTGVLELLQQGLS